MSREDHGECECPLSVLDEWIKKPNSVEITHDNGYGAHPGWTVKLWAGQTLLCEVHECDQAFLDEDGCTTWPGLGAVMLLAIERTRTGAQGVP